MIDETDRLVSAFVQEATGSAVWLDAPQPLEKREGVSLYLLELVQSKPARDLTPAPLQIDVRYLVTAWSSAKDKEHKALGDIAFAALEREDVSTSFKPIDPALWLAFGIPPRAAFFLQVPVRMERTIKRGPPVRETRTEVVPAPRASTR
jgi:hypothetical protein